MPSKSDFAVGCGIVGEQSLQSEPPQFRIKSLQA